MSTDLPSLGNFPGDRYCSRKGPENYLLRGWRQVKATDPPGAGPLWWEEAGPHLLSISAMVLLSSQAVSAGPGPSGETMRPWVLGGQIGRLDSLRCRGWLCSVPLSAGMLGGGCRGTRAAESPKLRGQNPRLPLVPAHLLLCGLNEQEGGLVSFTLEIEPEGRDHTCQS